MTLDAEGVGPELEQRLLAHFGSYTKIKKASWVDLQEVHGIGEVKAQRINPPDGLV